MIVTIIDNDSDVNNVSVSDEAIMLTTIDNPFNPFEEYDKWYAFDVQKGYNTCGYLARITKSSDELSEVDERLAIRMAIDEIVSINTLGIYRKVTKNSFVKKEN